MPFSLIKDVLGDKPLVIYFISKKEDGISDTFPSLLLSTQN